MSRSLQLVRFECLMKVMWQYQVRFFFLWSAYVRKNNLWKDKRRQCWSRPSDKRGTWSPKKIFFSPFGPQFGLKIRGGGRGGGSPGPVPWIRHWANSIKNLTGHFVHTEPFNTFAVFTRNWRTYWQTVAVVFALSGTLNKSLRRPALREKAQNDAVRTLGNDLSP